MPLIRARYHTKRGRPTPSANGPGGDAENAPTEGTEVTKESGINGVEHV